MKVAGVDIGTGTAKAVILDNDKMFSSINPIQNTWIVEAENILTSALQKANLGREDLECVIITGLVDEWDGADDYLSDVSCAANAAVHFFPAARTIIDMGAESSVVLKCDEAGIVTDYRVNQKCGSGCGLFFDIIAGALELKLSEIGEISLKSAKKIVMNSTCAVFAESEVVSLIHLGEKREDILMAVFDSVAEKTEALLKAIKIEEDVVFMGGVARNQGMVKSLSDTLGVSVKIPDNPDVTIALGAALEAKELV